MYKNVIFLIFNFTIWYILKRTLVLESIFNKVAGLQACNFIKKRLQHSCFPVKFAKLLRTPNLKNICERLLLCRPAILAFHLDIKGKSVGQHATIYALLNGIYNQ